MLVLSRRPNEEIVIAGGITLKVLSVQGKRVVFGFTGPDGISIIRAECLDHDQALPVPEAGRPTDLESGRTLAPRR